MNKNIMTQKAVIKTYLFMFIFLETIIYSTEQNTDKLFFECVERCHKGNDKSCIKAGLIAFENNKKKISAQYFSKAYLLNPKGEINKLVNFNSFNMLSCNYGFYSGCIVTSELFSKKKDYVNELRYLDKACSLGSLSSCDKLASLYSVGTEGILHLCEQFSNSDKDYCKPNSLERHTHKNIKHAIKYYDIICKSKTDATSCLFIYKYYSRGEGVPKNSKLANKYLRKACELYQFHICQKQFKSRN